MLVVMLVTFGSTAIASIRTDCTQLSMQVRIAAHKTGTKSAKIGAIAAGFDTIRHHLHHIAVETGSSASFTVAETLKASFDANLKLRIARSSSSHQITPEEHKHFDVLLSIITGNLLSMNQSIGIDSKIFLLLSKYLKIEFYLVTLR
jgi:pyruvate/oxaloacetate carboxyltransferase